MGVKDVRPWQNYTPGFVLRSVFQGNKVTLRPMENNFAASITNEELAELPVCAFGGRIVVVDSAEKAEEACKDLLSYDTIGFDTETRPTFRPGAQNKVALLQLSTPDACYLFRLCRMPLAKPIIKVLENEKTVKIGADIKNDLKALQELRHFSPKGFADLQSMVSDWGISDKSVRKMAGIILRTRVSKAQRLSNWEASNLTPAQQMYAATDAWVCQRMYDILIRTDKRPLRVQEKAVNPEEAVHVVKKKRGRYRKKAAVSGIAGESRNVCGKADKKTGRE